MQGTAELVSEARAALAAGEWERAREGFTRAAEEGAGAAAAEGLSWVAWYLDEASAAIDGFEETFRSYQAEQDRCGAARAAIWLAVSLLEFRGQFALATGWFERAQRLLDDGERCPEDGWLALHQAAIALESEGDAATARRIAGEVAELALALGRADLELLALAVEGLALVFEGELEAGLRRLDQAAAAAMAGEPLNRWPRAGPAATSSTPARASVITTAPSSGHGKRRPAPSGCVCGTCFASAGCTSRAL